MGGGGSQFALSLDTSLTLLGGLTPMSTTVLQQVHATRSFADSVSSRVCKPPLPGARLVGNPHAN